MQKLAIGQNRSRLNPFSSWSPPPSSCHVCASRFIWSGQQTISRPEFVVVVYSWPRIMTTFYHHYSAWGRYLPWAAESSRRAVAFIVMSTYISCRSAVVVVAAAVHFGSHVCWLWVEFRPRTKRSGETHLCERTHFDCVCVRAPWNKLL